jgi:hypothetical protein
MTMVREGGRPGLENPLAQDTDALRISGARPAEILTVR